MVLSQMVSRSISQHVFFFVVLFFQLDKPKTLKMPLLFRYVKKMYFQLKLFSLPIILIFTYSDIKKKTYLVVLQLPDIFYIFQELPNF